MTGLTGITTMFRGLGTLAWLETKIFVREPLGLFASVAVPVLIFVVLGRAFDAPGTSPWPARWSASKCPSSARC